MRKEIRIRILLGYGTLHAMCRHKAWRGGSSARQAAFPPPCMPLSKGGVWVGAAPPALQAGCLQSSISLKIQLPKTFKKWSNFLIKSLPKWSKIEAWRVSGHLPGGVLEGSGRLLGDSWLQEAQWVICRLLSGRSWAAPEPSWGPSWTQVEVQDGPKFLPRRPKMLLRCLQDSRRSDF